MTDRGAVKQHAFELRAAVRATAVLTLATAGVATLVSVVPGASARLKDAFAFSFERGRGGSTSEAVTYFATNTRVIAAVLVAAWARSRVAFGPLLDVPVAAIFAANVGLVGLALGAYGFRVVPWLVHLPLELAALGAAAAAYLTGRVRGLSARSVAATAGPAALLLAVAASMEAWATP